MAIFTQMFNYTHYCPNPYQGCHGRSQDEYFCDNPDYIFVIIDGQTEITADSQNSFSGTFQLTTTIMRAIR
jgi:hypothetical protein